MQNVSVFLNSKGSSNGNGEDKSKDEGINWVGGSDKSKCFPPKATATADEVRISCRKLLAAALKGLVNLNNEQIMYTLSSLLPKR